MKRSLIIAAAAVGILSSPAVAKEQTFNDEEQRAVLGICDLARYASRVQADQVCVYLERKIGQLPPPAQTGGQQPRDPATGETKPE